MKDEILHHVDDQFTVMVNELSSALGTPPTSPDRRTAEQTNLYDDYDDDDDSVDLEKLQRELKGVKIVSPGRKERGEEMDWPGSPSHQPNGKIISDSDNLEELASEAISTQQSISRNYPEKEAVGELSENESSFSTDGDTDDDNEDFVDENFVDEEDDLLLLDDRDLYSDEQYQTPIAPDPPAKSGALLFSNPASVNQYSSFEIDDGNCDDDEYGPASQLPHVEEIRAMQRGRKASKSVNSNLEHSWEDSHDEESKACYKFLPLFFLAGASLFLLFFIERRYSKFDDVISFLSNNNISKIEDLMSSGSPQNKAAIWIANNDVARVPMSTGHAFLDRYVLALLYFSLGGDSSWAHSLNFLQPSHVCNWGTPYKNALGNDLTFGVHGCRRIDDELVPVGISLAFHGLEGTLPDELRFLRELEVLILQYNPRLGGSLPSAIQELTKLRKLSLEHCRLSGSLPNWIGDLTDLTSLGLGDNRFTGAIPASIATLSNLRELGLNDNVLTGDLQLFGNLMSLEYLYLDNIIIQGQLTPSLVENWEKMQELDLSGNMISGTIPDNLFSHRRLKILDLHHNRFTGSIPSVNSEFNDALQLLSLYKNTLSGQIPASISSLVSLQHLDLSKNVLGGTVPISLGSMMNLKYLFLGSNQFSAGTIPDFLTGMENLEELSLWNTTLMGTISNKIGQLSNLAYLDLSKNILSGTLPKTFGLLTNLEYLLLRHNQLMGTLPTELADLSDLKLLLLETNEFSGHAQMICQSNAINLTYFGSDCGGTQPEIQCTCCTVCCDDSDVNCNNIAWEDGNLDPKQESDYKRGGHKILHGIRFDGSGT